LSVGLIWPVVMDDDCPMLSCGSCFGSFTCLGQPEDMKAAAQDLVSITPWLKQALTHVKKIEHDALEKMDDEDSKTSHLALASKAMRLQTLTLKKVQLEKLLRTQLSGMLAELKRYSKTSPSVVSITSGVIILLGNTQLLEALSGGLPKHENALKSIWDVVRGAMNTGKKDKEGKEGMVEAMGRFIPTLEMDNFTLGVVKNIWGGLEAEKIRHCSKAAVILYNWLTIVLDIFKSLTEGV